MAARNNHITISPDDWVELTDNDVTTITVQNLHEFQFVRLKATSGPAPTINMGSIHLPSGQIFVNEALADLFPGVSGAVRVFAKAEAMEGRVFVSHEG